MIRFIALEITITRGRLAARNMMTHAHSQFYKGVLIEPETSFTYELIHKCLSPNDKITMY